VERNVTAAFRSISTLQSLLIGRVRRSTQATARLVRLRACTGPRGQEAPGRSATSRYLVPTPRRLTQDFELAFCVKALRRRRSAAPGVDERGSQKQPPFAVM